MAHILERENGPDHQKPRHEVVLELRVEVVRASNIVGHRHRLGSIASDHVDDVLVVAELNSYKRS
ncbi:hypothetical protein GQ600_26385 [Phytophthora cactorum]|nr:hypothetical protein GQ600_26385 [Phytophthora cactorum]